MAHEDFDEDWNVDVINEGGVVTLRGTIPTKEHLLKVEEITAEQKGVVSVINELNIDEVYKKDSRDTQDDQNIDVVTGKRGQFGNK